MMAKLFSLIALAFCFHGNAQTHCKIAQTGTFEIDSGEYGVTKIERNEKMQTETNEQMGFQAKYDVTWIDDCHYELSNKKVLKGEARPGSKPTDIMKAEIVKVEGNKIFLRLSSNFSDFVTECEIVKVK